MTRYLIGFVFCLLLSCSDKKGIGYDTEPYLIILGIAQDAGYPQAGCTKKCCEAYWKGKETKKMVTSLGLVIPNEKKLFLIDITPDFKEQWEILQQVSGIRKSHPDGIFLTHAHMGHYTGLMHLGKEAMNSNEVPVYSLPRMGEYLKNNGPWSQLLSLKNIRLAVLKPDTAYRLTPGISVTPFLVPHRDEFSETAGFIIQSAGKKVLFIPDIDKWQKWNRNIIDEISKVDVALLDGSFYQNGEIDRDMSEIPHPFISESMKLFEPLSAAEKSKISFIHFNHSNPLISKSREKKELEKKGFSAARELEIIPMSP